MNSFKRKNGISLVALVITIIVLIILTAAVVITGINTPENTEYAVKMHNKATLQDAVTLYVMTEMLNNIDNFVVTSTGATKARDVADIVKDLYEDGTWKTGAEVKLGISMTNEELNTVFELDDKAVVTFAAGQAPTLDGTEAGNQSSSNNNQSSSNNNQSSSNNNQSSSNNNQSSSNNNQSSSNNNQSSSNNNQSSSNNNQSSGNDNQSGSTADSITMVFGNVFVDGYKDATNRAAPGKNIYLEAGTVISLKDSSTYNYACYKVANETTTSSSGNLGSGVWHDKTLTVDTSGWYGFAFKRLDNADFGFGTTDPNVLSGYVNITK